MSEISFKGFTIQSPVDPDELAIYQKLCKEETRHNASIHFIPHFIDDSPQHEIVIQGLTEDLYYRTTKLSPCEKESFDDALSRLTAHVKDAAPMNIDKTKRLRDAINTE